MALDQRRFDYTTMHVLRDTRPFYLRVNDFIQNPYNAAFILGVMGFILITVPAINAFSDIVFAFGVMYTIWLKRVPETLLFRIPAWMEGKKKKKNKDADGILFLGNRKDGYSFWKGEELWFSNKDVRTHFLYLGTTGSGKSEGLKSLASNALCWGSGFVYIDGKADTDLWATLSARVRRFGRDDDLFVLNYMTGNSDARAPSNSMNPFSSGSASYLTNMLVSLMPAAEGDNAMWKERAISLLSSLMPALTYMRDHLETPLSVSTIRRFLNLSEVIRLSRMDALPDKFRESIKGYLDTLPGYVDEAFDDFGRQKPMAPGAPMVDVQVPQQQHGYLTMQFTRALQSLGDDYGYIFDTENADVDMVDVVLNRRILVVLIPALEKSGDETANLGKIVAATLKGMMGSALGTTVEGSASTVIENKPTYSSTPFMCIFDEVGYYTAEGMAVMAAQARSLGFSLVFASQDLPAMEKRVKEEARSIVANCNIKIFGKLEDPNQTTELMEKAAGKAIVTEVGTFSMRPGSSSSSYFASEQVSKDHRQRLAGDHVRDMKEGEAGLIFGYTVCEMNVFYTHIGNAKAMRVQRFIGMEPLDERLTKHRADLVKLRDRLVHPKWKASSVQHSTADVPVLEEFIELLPRVPETASPVEKAAFQISAFIELTMPEALQAALERRSAPMPPENDGASAPSAQGQVSERSFDDMIGDDEDDQASGSGSDTRRLGGGDYDPDLATEETLATGRVILPEGLTEEAESLLKDAVKTLTTGLFAKPSPGGTPGMGGLPVGGTGGNMGGGGGQ